MVLKKGYKQLLAEAEARITTLSVDDAKARRPDENVLLVDLRDIRELDREGMIPGALHAPRGMLEFWVDPDSPYHRDVFASGKDFIFYCQSGWRSALATDTLQTMGFENVAHIEGGFKAWKEAGGDVGPKPEKKKG